MKKKNNEDQIKLTEEHDTRKIVWYPGHMVKALNKIKERLKMVDIVLEVRDARSPQASGNSELKKMIGDKNLLIVINKTNLADPKVVESWEQWFSQRDEPYLFVNCFDETSLKEILQKSKRIVQAKKIQSNKSYQAKKTLKMMIIGLPNTGKSTIINRLSGRNATKVADKPGQTKQQLWVKATDEINILDNPGVMPPAINDYEHGIWLGLIHAIPEKIVEPEITASYLVNHLLNKKSEIFKNLYKLETLDTDLIGALNQIAKNRGYLRKGNQFDYDRVYKTVLADFRKGDLGLISFGAPPE